MKEKQKVLHMSKTAKRFVTSFLIVLILPVASFIFLFQQSFRDIYRGKIIEQSQKTLETVGMDFDRKVESLRTLVDFQAIDNKMQKAVRQGEKGNETIIDTLFAALVSYSFLEDVYYYDQIRPQLVYSSVGTYTTHYYAKLKGGMESQTEFQDQLKQIRQAEWKIWGDHLLYVVRDGNSAWWMFGMNRNELRYLIASENTRTSLLDNNGNLLFASGKEAETEYEITFLSKSNSFQLTREIEEKYLFGELDVWQRNFVIAVFLIMLAGGVIVMLLTYYNEQPMKRLLDYSKEKIPDIPPELDGLEAFQFTLQSIEEQAEYRAEKQERDYLLLKLIYGQDCDSESFQESIRSAALFEKAQCYRVVMIAASDGQEIDRNKISLYLGMQENQEFEFQLTDLSREDTAVMIVGMTETAEQELKDELLLMGDIIAESIDEKIRFFVGGKCTRFSELHLSYSQAYACSQRKEEKETGTVVFYKSSHRHAKKYQYPKAELSILYDALVETNLEAAISVTDVLIAILEEQSDNRFTSVALYYDILNTYYRALTKLEKDEEFDLKESDMLMVKENTDAVSMIYRISEQYRDYVEKNTKEPMKQTVSEEEYLQHSESNAIAKEKISTKNVEKTDGEKLVFRVLAYIDENIR